MGFTNVKKYNVKKNDEVEDKKEKKMDQEGDEIATPNQPKSERKSHCGKGTYKHFTTQLEEMMMMNLEK